ncbi:MAG TPA: 5-oxoprolinase subunit PxpA [Lacunisphaera sp.]|nr:5-oxoprolinase subunit PxpA [Lacunisphaera sp.]
MQAVDLNCDLGEGAGHDPELMPLISSANIACGGHAGDGTTMRATVQLALRHGVEIGAHPGFPDRENFGRTERPATPGEIRGWVLAQTRALMAVADGCGGRVGHVKPHGALYNLAARSPEIAGAVADGVWAADPRLRLVGLAGSAMIEAGMQRGLGVVNEAFADRAYVADGSLAPRSQPGAILEEREAVAQVLRLVRDGKVKALDGAEIGIRAESICLHGDGVSALALARAIRSALLDARISIRARPAR